MKEAALGGGLFACPCERRRSESGKLLQRISYSIESAFYSGADTGDTSDNEDGKGTRDQRVFDGRGPRVIVHEIKDKFRHC